jgi:GNAT superfamily N-acetyltransferase
MSEDGCVIRPLAGELPSGFDEMLDEALRGGHEFLVRFDARRREGGERYEGEHEGLFGAFVRERLVGIAAIGLDPYAGDPTVGRIRHVYVLGAARRKGVAAALVAACLERGRGFRTIRLRSRNPEATRLYERFGFRPLALKDSTHRYHPGEDAPG